MRALVTGGSGQLGTAFRALLPDAHYPGRDELDLTRPGEVHAGVTDLRPDLIINCAAYTAVDAAEDDEMTARAVNAESVERLARYAATRSIPLVTFSTDYVFDGEGSRPYVESDPTGPINAYGRTKLAGEQLALNAHSGVLIIRTSWVISGTHPNFVATMVRLAAERELRVVNDQHGCPTVADDLARATLALLDRGVTGVVHVTNQGATTWYELARTAVQLAGLDPERISPCTTEEYPRPAARPRHSVLGSERFAGTGVDPLPHWRQSLPAVVTGLRDRGLA